MKSCFLGVKNNFKILLSEDYIHFDESRIEFRKSLVRGVRTSLTLFLTLFMIIVFSFQRIVSYLHYVGVPLSLVFNLIMTTFVLRKKYEVGATYYISFLLLAVPIVGIEMSLVVSYNYVPQKAILFGYEVGMLFGLFLISKAPSPHLMLISIIFFTYIIIRGILLELESQLVSNFIYLGLFLLINYIYIKQELLDFKVWLSLRESCDGLNRFRRLLHVFPIQMILINKESWEKDKELYMNEEAEKQLGEQVSIKSFLDSFLIEGIVGSFQKDFKGFEQPIEYQSLTDRVKELLAESSSSFGEFQTYLVNYDKKELGSFNFASSMSKDELEAKPNSNLIKFEVKVGSIKWGDSLAVALILNDINKSEKIRELRLLHENKDQLLATVSHELRTPLNGIIGMVDVAYEEVEKDPNSVREYLDVAKSSAKTLLLMINDILDISQIQKGKLRLTIVPSDLYGLIDRVLPLIKVQMKNKGLQLLYENDSPNNTMVLLDPGRFQQILLNLLSNACKFTPQGFVKLSVRYKQMRNRKRPSTDRRSVRLGSFFSSSKEIRNNVISHIDSKEELLLPRKAFHNYKVKISVEDTGIGITKENVSKLFQLFAKLEHNGNASGVGLGLAISQRLAEQMCLGPIKVKSTIGKGTLFWFSISASSPEKLLIEELSDNGAEEYNDENNSTILVRSFESLIQRSRPDKKKYRLLIVEDDQVNQLVLQQYLKPFGSELLSDKAFNGAEALSIIQRQAEEKVYYDLIVMDCDMPIMNGLQASQRILEMVKLEQIPPVNIIALTANASHNDRDLCLQHGMIDVWNKPISKLEFLQNIKNYLKFL